MSAGYNCRQTLREIRKTARRATGGLLYSALGAPVAQLG